MALAGELTIGQLIDRRVERTPRHVFCRFEGRELTCEALAMDVNRIANALTDGGLRREDRVGTMLHNGPGHVATMLAILRLGLVWLPINYHLKGPSLAYQLTHADPALMIVDREFEEAATAVGGAERHVVAVGADAELVNSVVSWSGAVPSSEPPGVTIDPEDIAAISYTSGTTGQPKGVLLTDRLLRTCARGVKATLRAQPGEVLFFWEPQHHIAGLQMIIYALMDEVTLAMQPRFSASRFWSEARASDARYAHYVGSVLQILLKQPPTPSEREHGVSVLWGGGCPREIWDTVRGRFGVELREVWGMTETASISTVNIGGPKGSVGKALEQFDVAVQAMDGNGMAPPGVSGQIVVRALERGVLTTGYFRNEDASRGLYRDGWLQTGDLGSMDEHGNVYFQGRLKDSLRVRGENVSAWEVEAVINTYPEVLQSAVIGVPSELGDDEIKAFVRVRDPEQFAPDALASWCAERMAAYQAPRYIAVVSEFDMTTSNRIRKERLSPSTTDCFDRERVQYLA
jgi:crotonobetaine/carnitine-CoA ligase